MILACFFHGSLQFSEMRLAGVFYSSLMVPNFLTIHSWFLPLKMEHMPGKWPKGRKNLNLLKTMLDNTKQDITQYELNIRELSTTQEMRCLHKQTIKQYEYMIEELKRDYKEISKELEQIDRI